MGAYRGYRERMVVKTLEPRMLLSADFTVIAPLLVDNFDQLDDQLDGFFDKVRLFHHRLWPVFLNSKKYPILDVPI